MKKDNGGNPETHLMDLPRQYKGLAHDIVWRSIGRKPDAVDEAGNCTSSPATAPKPTQKTRGPRTMVTKLDQMAKGDSLNLLNSPTALHKRAHSLSSLVHDAGDGHVVTESEHLRMLQHRLQTTRDNTRARLYQLKNSVVVPNDDARSSLVLNACNCFCYSLPMPTPFATHPEWIWCETQLTESPHMLDAFSLWCRWCVFTLGFEFGQGHSARGECGYR